MRLSLNQKEHLLQWLGIFWPGEILVVYRPSLIRLFLRMAAIGFWAGWWLRLLRCYPGKTEPAWVDFFSGLISFSLQICHLESRKKGALFLPLVLLPHVIYILSQPEIGQAGWRNLKIRV
ncbi:MAG: hypothetical protein NC911_04450 [Candidatus Omnitrophica bacterium]|nr:hypothetical protein [Candidatus Omnitrophota bacterium]